MSEGYDTRNHPPRVVSGSFTEPPELVRFGRGQFDVYGKARGRARPWWTPSPARSQCANARHGRRAHDRLIAPAPRPPWRSDAFDIVYTHAIDAPFDHLPFVLRHVWTTS